MIKKEGRGKGVKEQEKVAREEKEGDGNNKALRRW